LEASSNISDINQRLTLRYFSDIKLLGSAL